jgi:hypothetical protein
MADSQKMGRGEKSGGQRIDDHKFWAGGPTSEAVLAGGAKSKREDSAEGAGNVSRYEDTTETIKEQQVKGAKKIHAHPMKPDYRN